GALVQVPEDKLIPEFITTLRKIFATDRKSLRSAVVSELAKLPVKHYTQEFSNAYDEIKLKLTTMSCHDIINFLGVINPNFPQLYNVLTKHVISQGVKFLTIDRMASLRMNGPNITTKNALIAELSKTNDEVNPIYIAMQAELRRMGEVHSH
ncbi:MAG: hypothetical protein Q8K36_05455, partial [Alphaproteobacteria bacterium]|nr:hypothetical protein [Alphaproteobacteria bacterium]